MRSKFPQYVGGIHETAFRHIGVAPLALPDQPHEHEHERRIAG